MILKSSHDTDDYACEFVTTRECYLLRQHVIKRIVSNNIFFRKNDSFSFQKNDKEIVGIGL